MTGAASTPGSPSSVPFSSSQSLNHAHNSQWPAPTLAAADGWITRLASVGGIATGEAATVPLRDPKGVFPTETLRSMPADGVVIFASGYLTQTPWRLPRARPLPYELSQFRHDHGWETQPAANVPQYVLFTSLHKHLLDVRVFFGTQHPSHHQVARAQAELDTLSWG